MSMILNKKLLIIVFISVSFERRRSIEEDDGQEKIERLVNRLEGARESGEPITSQ